MAQIVAIQACKGKTEADTLPGIYFGKKIRFCKPSQHHAVSLHRHWEYNPGLAEKDPVLSSEVHGFLKFVPEGRPHPEMSRLTELLLPPITGKFWYSDSGS